MVAEGNALVDGEPVPDKVHEILKHGFEIRITRDSDGDVDSGTDGGPDEAGHALGEFSSEHLHGEADGVDVWAVVGNDAEREDYKAKFSESSQRAEEYGCEESTGSGGGVSVGVLVYAVVESRGCHDGDAEHFCKQKWNHETDPDGEEDLGAGLVRGLVDGVISGIARPSSSKSVDHGAKTEYAAQFGDTDAHGDVDEVAGVRKHAQSDDEDDGGGDPGPEFVDVDYFVAEEGDEKSTDGDYDNTGVAGDVVVDSVD